jgi:hypothetical protein
MIRRILVRLLPCVRSFASIPSVAIPVSDTLVDLQPTLGDLVRMGQAQPCVNKLYDYSGAPPPVPRSYLPLVRR